MDKRGVSLANMILVLGVLTICAYAILTFYQSGVSVRNSFAGIGSVEQLDAQIEKNKFANEEGVSFVALAEDRNQDTSNAASTAPETTISSETSITKDDSPTNPEVITKSIGSYSRQIYEAVLFAQEGPIGDRNFLCGEKCFYYSQLIEKYSNTYGIDPVLTLSLIMQESQGRLSATSVGDSVGLMQVNLNNCGSYGLPQDKAECKKLLTTNADKNIEVGLKILTEKYNQFKGGKIFQGCSNKNIKYIGWEAALRGYNGWSCGCNYNKQTIVAKDKCSKEESGKTIYGTKIYAQDNFVEEVIERYKKLLGTYNDATITQENIFQEKTSTFFSAQLVEK